MTSEEYDKLSDMEKRIKIAELCGWQCRNHFANKSSDKATWEWHHKDLVERDGDEYWYSVQILPDYLNDLSACHAFEKTLGDLRDDKYLTYIEYLSLAGQGINGFSRISATAAQRCKAFALTILDGRNE